MAKCQTGDRKVASLNPGRSDHLFPEHSPQILARKEKATTTLYMIDTVQHAKADITSVLPHTLYGKVGKSPASER